MPTDFAAIDRLLSWEGIGRTFLDRIAGYEETVRANAPFRLDSTDAVHLVDTIGHTISTEGPLLTARVGCNPWSTGRGYAWIVHRGSREHPILPRRPGGRLKFKFGGRTIYATRVFHPGTTPDPFLTRWMKEITK